MAAAKEKYFIDSTVLFLSLNVFCRALISGKKHLNDKIKKIDSYSPGLNAIIIPV
jgi:hypothetical protein